MASVTTSFACTCLEDTIDANLKQAGHGQVRTLGQNTQDAKIAGAADALFTCWNGGGNRCSR